MAADNPRTTPGMDAVLTIGGSDSSGGAGIQAHLKTFAVMQVFGCSAITAITAQNTTGVKHSHLLDVDWITQQIDAVAADIDIKATVTGMLGSAKIIDAVVKTIKRAKLYPLIVDPVMIAKSGDPLLDDDAVDTLCRKLVGEAAIVTPNRFEAAKMLGKDAEITTAEEASGAAIEIVKRFKPAACIVTGIRRPNDEEGEAVDIFYDGDGDPHELAAPWRNTRNTHGAGCTFAAALTAALALGQLPLEAAQTAKNVVSEAIRQQTDLGQGTGPVNHSAWAKVGG